MARLEWSERVAILGVTVRQTFAGVIAALIGWWLILGADPRQAGESRHFAAIVASAGWLISVGIVLNLSSRYGSRYPWKWMRAGQLGAIVGLLQLGLAQPSLLLKISVAALGVFAVIACIVAWWRIVTNIKRYDALDAYATYGFCAAALLISGAYHAQTIQLNVNVDRSSHVARYQVNGWLGLVELQTRELHGVTGCEYASAFDYGTGCVLIGDGGEKLFIRGVLQNWTVAGRTYENLQESIEGLEPFDARENRIWVLGLYAILAIGIFWFGAFRDPFSYGNTLLRHGDLLADREGKSSHDTSTEDGRS